MKNNENEWRGIQISIFFSSYIFSSNLQGTKFSIVFSAKVLLDVISKYNPNGLRLTPQFWYQ